MSSTPLIWASIGVATDCSTVCASAPTKDVWIRISGGTILGNWETGRLIIETAPTMTIRMAITMATMGRLMKKRYIEDDQNHQTASPAIWGGEYFEGVLPKRLNRQRSANGPRSQRVRG